MGGSLSGAAERLEDVFVCVRTGCCGGGGRDGHRPALCTDVGGAGNQVKTPLHLPAKSPATTVRGSVSVCGYRKYQTEVVSTFAGKFATP